uniref:HTH_48 domain-containing protein n=1 Tax=Heterorhabditis bacteriophora TaxID=37862 RepID=A0A1I7WE49_HETBA
MEKKQIRAILLYEFKLGPEAVETARNINQAFGQENHEEGRGRPLVIDDIQLRVIVEAEPCKTTREVAEELDVVYLTVARHFPKWGNQKISTKYTKNCKVDVQHWSIEKYQFFSMTMSDHISYKWLCRNLTNWPTRLYLIQLTHQTSLPPTITFSSISTTSYKRKYSTTKELLKTPSKNSSVPGRQNSM